VQQLAEQEPTENAAEPIVDHELAAARLTGYYGAAFDMPLYFDLMLFYLRIQLRLYHQICSRVRGVPETNQANGQTTSPKKRFEWPYRSLQKWLRSG
jgi:hypothetical protein